PGTSAIDAPPPSLPEPLADALATGTPSSALGWLRQQPAGREPQTTQLLLRALAGATPPELLGPLAASRASWAEVPLTGAALGVLLGAARLATGDLDGAEAVAQEQLELGRHRRNGLVVADAAL